jgi:hypothetical protein
VGWWERPRGAPGGRQRPGAGRFQYQEEAEEELSPWQEEQLKVAYAMGRRKMKVCAAAVGPGDVGSTAAPAWLQDFVELGCSDAQPKPSHLLHAQCVSSVELYVHLLTTSCPGESTSRHQCWAW